MNTLCLLVTTSSVWLARGALRDFDSCHDDFTLKPPDGILKRNSFNWLGFVQYKHVVTGEMHRSIAPRVVLVQKQYAIGPAKELLLIPTNYKLGNVVFGEYEREEEECHLTDANLKLGEKCPHAYMEMPLQTITPHPEFSRFGVKNSLALVKLIRPMKSRYMMPICLPSLAERSKKKRDSYVSLIDYMSLVPMDFSFERMAKKTLQIYSDDACRDKNKDVNLLGISNFLCSTGCGVRFGAPIIIQATEGSFELIGIAVSGGPCKRKSMRSRFIDNPPLYIDVYPYSNWIINVITANELPSAYQHNFRRLDSHGSGMAIYSDYVKGALRKRKIQYEGWRARTYLVGNFCRKSLKKQKRAKAAFFYFEQFEVISGELPTTLFLEMKNHGLIATSFFDSSLFTLFMRRHDNIVDWTWGSSSISSGIDCSIICARLLLPSRATKPVIKGIGGFNLSVTFTTDQFPERFYYSLGLTGKNSSERKLARWLEYVPQEMRGSGIT